VSAAQERRTWSTARSRLFRAVTPVDRRTALTLRNSGVSSGGDRSHDPRLEPGTVPVSPYLGTPEQRNRENALGRNPA